MLDIKVYHYPRKAIFHEASRHAEMMHSSKTKTMLVMNKESDSLNLASTCMHSRMTTLLASEGLVSHCDVRLGACLRVNVWLTGTRDWLALSLSNSETGSIFMDGT